MTRFSSTSRSSAALPHPRERVWAALSDPELLPRLTPNLTRIDADGDRWTWHLGQVSVLGRSLGLSFTELMAFDEPSRIDFTHDESATGEKAWVEGTYLLTEQGQGCEVAIDLTVTADLPFPRLARPGVETAMATVMAGMGRGFGRNLERHLRGD